MSERTSEFFDRYAVNFDSIYGNDNKALERIAIGCSAAPCWCAMKKPWPAAADRRPQRHRYRLRPGPITASRWRAPGPKGLRPRFRRRHAQDARATARSVTASRNVPPSSWRLSSTIRDTEQLRMPVVIGFMDYVADPRAIIDRVLDVTRVHAFFSFPKAGGRSPGSGSGSPPDRCDLFLYRRQRFRFVRADQRSVFDRAYRPRFLCDADGE